MSKVVIKVDEGCESIYEVATNELSKIQADVDAEKEIAYAEIERKYADKKERLVRVINTVAHEEIVEDEEPVIEETINETNTDETLVEETPNEQ